MATSISSPTAPAGGTSTADATGRLRPSAVARPSLAGPSGSSVTAPTPSSPPTRSSAPSPRKASGSCALDTCSGQLDVLDCPYTDINYLRRQRSGHLHRRLSNGSDGGGARRSHHSSLRGARAAPARRPSMPATCRCRGRSSSPPKAARRPMPSSMRRPTAISPLRAGAAAAAGAQPRRADSATSSTLKLDIQFWTSRGIGVLDVNYGGSTGYGTAYRRRLEWRLGHCRCGRLRQRRRYLVERGEADGSAAGDSRRQCRRLHDALRPDLPRRLSGRERVTMA